MKNEMRLQFNDEELKSKIQDLAKSLDISMNMLVNLMLSSYFSEKDRKSIDLLLQISKLNIDISCENKIGSFEGKLGSGRAFNSIFEVIACKQNGYSES